MLIEVNQRSEEPLYQQIRDQIVSGIARGDLKPGDVLPSVRSLASDLGINLHTVNKAYALLKSEGYVIMRGRSKTYIADVTHNATPEQQSLAEKALAQRIYELALEYRARGGNAGNFLKLVKEKTALAFSE